MNLNLTSSSYIPFSRQILAMTSYSRAFLFFILIFFYLPTINYLKIFPSGLQLLRDLP